MTESGTRMHSSRTSILLLPDFEWPMICALPCAAPPHKQKEICELRTAYDAALRCSFMLRHWIRLLFIVGALIPPKKTGT